MLSFYEPSINTSMRKILAFFDYPQKLIGGICWPVPYRMKFYMSKLNDSIDFNKYQLRCVSSRQSIKLV